MMFSSLSVSNFRGFKDLKVEGFDRFNLVLGPNNSGKTAFLEALFLLVGPTNPQLTLTVSAFRGIASFRNDPEDVWGWLFYAKKLNSEIKLIAKTPSGAKRSLLLSLGEPKTIRLSKKSTSKRNAIVSSATTGIGPGELIMDFEHEGGFKTRTKAFIKETGIGVEPGKTMKLPFSIYVSARGGYSSESATRFSKLEEEGRHTGLLEPLRILEPRLQRLAVLVSSDGPMVFGDIGIGRMLPLPLMGEGIGRLLSLLLAIESSPGGIVMVDEIETGFHYSVLPTMWKAILQAARNSDVQMFSTTHSWECVTAAHAAFSESDKYDLSLHRLDRNKEIVTSTAYDKEMIETALTSGMELR